YSADSLQEIRTRFQNDRVIVVDANEVLCDTDEKGLEINPNAEAALRDLHDLSYSLILWSSAKKQYLDGFLKDSNLRGYFDMIIARENYAHWNIKTGQQDEYGDDISVQEPQYKSAVDNTAWLNSFDKEQMTDYYNQRSGLL